MSNLRGAPVVEFPHALHPWSLSLHDQIKKERLLRRAIMGLADCREYLLPQLFDFLIRLYPVLAVLDLLNHLLEGVPYFVRVQPSIEMLSRYIQRALLDLEFTQDSFLHLHSYLHLSCSLHFIFIKSEMQTVKSSNYIKK